MPITQAQAADGDEAEIVAATPELAFFDVLRFVGGYWRRQPARLTTILSLYALASLVETYMPSTLSAFLASVRQQADAGAIEGKLLIFLLCYVAQTMIFAVGHLVYNLFETRTFEAIVNDAFEHVHRLPEHFFVNTFAGSIISKISRARSKIETLEDRLLIDVFSAMVVLAGSIVFLGRQFPFLALLMLVYLVVLIGISMAFVFRVSGPAQGDYADAQDRFVAHLADSISGTATTKSYAQEDYETTRFFDMTRKLRRINTRAYLLSTLASMAQRALLSGMLALMMGGGTWYFLHGKASVENIAYLAFAYTILQSYIQRLGFNIKDILTSSYDLHAVIALLRQPPEVPLAAPLPPLVLRQGRIAFEKVTFAYPGKARPVFKDLSIEIRAGERVALVGHSGSGKTTFVRLLQALYGPQQGRIRIDGQDIAAGSRASLRGAIALVPQDPVLFHRSLADNIAYGRPGATMAKIIEAAEKAYIRPFIESLPQGYDTLVGERGIKLSGGERQRIAIARAILADRPILILDEATSSLDTESERAIQNALVALTHGRTSIMIAHRLSTILDADRILVFDQGRIVEEGTHARLAEKPGGLYAGFYRLQSGGFIPD